MKVEDPKKKLVRGARHLYQRGLTPGSGGNLSLTEDGKIYITPSGISFRELTPMDISIIDLGGNRISGPKPSSEYRMHLALLQSGKGIKAVCHAHGVYTVAFSILARPGEDVIPPITPGLALAGPVPLLPKLLAGSEELADAVKVAVAESKAKAVILKNHGIVCLGKDLSEAINLCEEIEAGLTVWFLARKGLEPFPHEMVRKLRETYGLMG